MAKISLASILSKFSSITSLNANFTAIANAFENTLSRDGTSPNAMGADLDMDSNRIINLPVATLPTEAVRFDQITTGGLSDTDSLPEGSTNLYFTNERVDDRVDALLIGGTNVTLTYNDGAGTLTIDAAGGGSIAVEDDDASIVASATTLNFAGAGVVVTDAGSGQADVTISGASIADTDALPEGSTNLYFTDERVDDRVNALLIGGTNVTLTYNDPANTLTIDAAGGDVAVEDDNVSVLSAATTLNFAGAGVVVTDAGSGQADITIAGGSGGQGGGGFGLAGWRFRETLTTTGGTQLDIDVSEAAAVMLVFRGISTSSSGSIRVNFSPDGGTTLRNSLDYLVTILDATTESLTPTANNLAISATPSTDTTYAIFQVYGLNYAQRKPYITHSATAGTPDTNVRWGYSLDAEVIDTIAVLAQAGTFDEMAVDVWIIDSGGSNTQTGTSYTLVAGDKSKLVEMNNASANTLTIPTNASVAFPIGTEIGVQQIGAGTTTVDATTGVTLNGTSSGQADITARYDEVRIRKRGTDEWVITGNHGTVT